MSKHAPGPWRAIGKTVKSVHHQKSYAVARVGNDLFTDECNQANACLIAAAPELLDMLYAALPFIEDAKDDPAYKPGYAAKVEHDIRTAIAKATNAS